MTKEDKPKYISDPQGSIRDLYWYGSFSGGECSECGGLLAHEPDCPSKEAEFAKMKGPSFAVYWGVDGEGRPRNPCLEDPKKLAGQPLGMYHCPICGVMQMAGMEHLPPEDDYEATYGREWPPGYSGTEGDNGT